MINKEDFERLDNLSKDIEIQWVSTSFLNDILNVPLVKFYKYDHKYEFY